MKAFELITSKIGLTDRMGYSDCLPERDVEKVEKYSYEYLNGLSQTETGYFLLVVMVEGFQREFGLQLSLDGMKVTGNMDRRPNGAVLVASWDAEGNPVSLQGQADGETEEESGVVDMEMDYPSKDNMMTYRQYDYVSDLALEGKVEGFPMSGSTYSRMRKMSKFLASRIIEAVKDGKIVRIKE